MSAPDLHLLPFDGSYDFATMVKRLDRHGFSGALTLEVDRRKRDDYKEMSAEEYLATAYERALRVSELSES